MADKETGEDILRAILEKGSDKAKKDAANVLSSIESMPAEVKSKKTKKSLGELVGKIGKSTYFKKSDGTIVDETDKPVSNRLQEAFRKNVDVKTGLPKAPVRVGVQKNKQLESTLQKTIISAKKLAVNSEFIQRKMPDLTDQLSNIANNLYQQNQITIRNLIKKNEEFRDAVIEQLTGVRGPTKAGGAVFRPRPPSAVTPVSGSKLARAAEVKSKISKATAFRESRPAEVQARAARIGAIRARRNVAIGAAAAVGGAAIGAGAVIAAATMGGAPPPPSGGPPPGPTPAPPGPTGTQPSAGIRKSNVPGMVTLTTPISKRQYVVAEQYANNFKGFVDELENSGYQIKSIGGYANRNIAGTNQKSFHALGVSIDINPSTNPHTFPPQGLITDMPSNISAMARKYGLGWGGEWSSSKDAMHFSMAAQEGGSVRVDRSGVAPLPGAPETPGTREMAARAGAAPPTLPSTQTPPSGGPTPAGTMGATPMLAPTQTPSAGGPTAAPSATPIGGAPTVKNIAQYIVSKAQSMGVDPNLALGIAAYEGLNPNTINSPTFGNRDARGYSFGPYQLYSGSPDPTRIAPGGMAAEFMQKYGEPPSASNWQKQVDFSLELMKRRGPAGLERGPWYAVRDRGGVASITRLGAAYAAQQGVVPGQLTPPGAATAPTGAPTPSLPQTQTPSAGAPTAAPSTGPAVGTGGVGALAGPGGQENVAGAPSRQGGGNVREAQSGIRRLPISDKLRSVLQQAAKEAGVDVVVTSGGQPEYPKGPRTGSTRHDLGNAADLDLYVGGRILTDANPQDVELKKKFVAAAAAAGASGIGAGYMGPTKIHVGFGTQATWGGAAWMRGISPGSGSAETQVAGGPSGPSAARSNRQATAETMRPQQQMAAMSQQSAMQDFFGGMTRAQQPIIMNNTRMINNTRTVFQQPSYVPSRGRMEDFNPLVIAGTAAGFGIARALRIF